MHDVGRSAGHGWVGTMLDLLLLFVYSLIPMMAAATVLYDLAVGGWTSISARFFAYVILPVVILLSAALAARKLASRWRT